MSCAHYFHQLHRSRLGPADFPPGFVGGDDRTPADQRAQRVIGRLRPARRTVDRLHEATARDLQAQAIAQQLRDAAERQPTLFIEQHRQGDRLGPEVRAAAPSESKVCSG